MHKAGRARAWTVLAVAVASSVALASACGGKNSSPGSGGASNASGGHEPASTSSSAGGASAGGASSGGAPGTSTTSSTSSTGASAGGSGGGGCVGNACNATQIARHASGLVAIAVDDTDVVWSTDSLWIAPKDGSGTPLQLVPDVGPKSIAIIGDTVYYVYAGLVGVPKAGGTPAPVTGGERAQVPFIVANGAPFWYTQDSNNRNAIITVPFTGGTPQMIPSDANDFLRDSVTAQLATDGTTLFSAGFSFGGGSQYFVASLPTDGGPSTTLSAADLHAVFALNDDWLLGVPALHTVCNKGPLKGLPRSGGHTLTKFAAAVSIEQLMADATHAYWFNSTANCEGAVYRTALTANSTPERLAGPMLGGSAFTMDDSYIYFVDSRNALVRIAK
jgi:hypothetical protein